MQTTIPEKNACGLRMSPCPSCKTWRPFDRIVNDSCDKCINNTIPIKGNTELWVVGSDGSEVLFTIIRQKEPSSILTVLKRIEKSQGVKLIAKSVDPNGNRSNITLPEAKNRIIKTKKSNPAFRKEGPTEDDLKWEYTFEDKFPIKAFASLSENTYSLRRIRNSNFWTLSINGFPIGPKKSPTEFKIDDGKLEALKRARLSYFKKKKQLDSSN